MLSIKSRQYSSLIQVEENPLSSHDIPEDKVNFWKKWLGDRNCLVTVNREAQSSGRVRWQVIVLKEGMGGKIEAEGLLSKEWESQRLAEQSANQIANILQKKYMPHNQEFTVVRRGPDGKLHSFVFSLQIGISKHPVIGRIHTVIDPNKILPQTGE